MGNLINPIGGHVNGINFWRSMWSICYEEDKQDIYFQISVHIRMLLNVFLNKVFLQNPNHFDDSVLHGIVLKLVSNIWGFSNKNLSIYLKIFDYKASVLLLKVLPHRYYLQRFFAGFSRVLKIQSYFLGPKPMLLIGKKQNLYSRWCSVLFPFLYSKRYKFKVKLKKFILDIFKVFFMVLKKKVRSWHLNLIVFSRSYLLYLCKMFKFKKCFLFTSIGKSTITAAMIARYMVLKFQQGFSLNFILKTIRRTIRVYLANFSGYKICVSGRFTRKQIATYRWFRSGSILLNQRVSGIDYVQDGGVSKFGLYGIKIWVFADPVHF